MDRRSFLYQSGVLAAGSLVLGGAEATTKSPESALTFDQLLARAVDGGLVGQGRMLRERQSQEYMELAERALRDRRPLSTVPISDRATQMIWVFEITSPAQYTRAYRWPTWPRGQSGVTIGVGYDIGYVTPRWLHEDWDTALTPARVAPLEVACGVTGLAARQLISKLRFIEIDWPTARDQFKNMVLPRYVSDTLAALPKAQRLGADCLGALVSLTYNRGASYSLLTDRYREMRSIKQHVENEQYDLVPTDIRAMKRLWQGQPDLAGLITRRELEAKLFEEGLRNRSS
jgi:hypothetical protein